MDASDLLYRHGDKFAVSLVALLCVYGIWSACTDPAIRPADLKADEIIARIDQVRQAGNTQQPPTLKDAPDHLGELHQRFTFAFQPRPVLADLTLHPDLGRDISKTDRFYYIYELKPPTVVANDKVGSVEVAVTAPPSLPHSDDRVSDKPEVSWSRSLGKDSKEKADNHAAIVGYVIQEKTAGQDWHQIGEVTADNPTLQVKDVKAFETYNFRAMTIVKATGLGDTSDSSVIVLRGSFPQAQVPWETLNPTTPPISALLADPVKIPGFKVVGTEQLFASDASDAFELQVGIDMKIALKKVGGMSVQAAALRPDAGTASPDDPPPDESGAEAQFLIFKFDPAAKGGGDWVGPLPFKAKVGDKVGKVEGWPLVGGIRKKNVDFGTPFVLDRIERGKDRVIFYELKLKARAGGGKDKDLEFEPKKAMVNAAVLKDPKTKMELVLLELGSITRPARAGTVIFPEYPAGTFKEEAEFAAHPGTFKQAGLVPPKPIAHQHGQGPLQQLFQAGNMDAQTDTMYYELGDGRLIFWDPVNHQLGPVLYKPGAEPKATDDKDGKKPEEAPAEGDAKEPAAK